MKHRHKLSNNCKIEKKNCKVSGPCNFWTSVKRNVPDVWNETFGPCLIRKLKLGGHGPPVATLLQSHDNFYTIFLIKRKCSKLSCVLKNFSEKRWVCEIKNRTERNKYFLLVCYFQQQEKCRKSLTVLQIVALLVS